MVQKHWIALGLVLLTTVCFGHVVACDFVSFDDPLYVTSNPHVLGGLTWTNVVWAFGASCHWAGYWVPLTWLSLQADASLFGPRGAWGFHLTNLVLHEINVVLFFYGLRRMTGDTWRSALAAAIFALHPLRVESVAWVTERKDMLSTLFLLLTVGAYQLYAERPTLGRYGLVCLSFFVGLSAKPTLVTLPFALLLLDYWPLGRVQLGQLGLSAQSAKKGTSWSRLLLEKAPLIALAVGASWVTMHYASSIGAVKSLVPWGHQLAAALSGYLGYLEKTFWPTDLALLYPFYVPSTARVLLAVVVLAGITLGCLRLARREPALIVGWLWFLGTMFPVCGIVQVGVQALADRYTYVPHLGLIVALVWGSSALLSRVKITPAFAKTLLGLALLALGVLTWIQVWYWQNGETLFTHALRVTKNNPEMHRSLSGFWFDRGEMERAEQQIILAIDTSPTNDAKDRFFYGVILVRRDAFAEAAVQLQESLQLDPTNPDAEFLMGVIDAKQGRHDEAKLHFQRSVALWSSHPSKDFALGDMKRRQAVPHLFLGEDWLRNGMPQKALDHFDRALAIAPDLAEAHQLRGVTLGRLERWADAEDALRTAVDLAPKDAVSQAYLAFAYARQEKKEQAARAYAEVLERFPDWPADTAANALTLVTKASVLDQKTAAERIWQVCEATGFKEARWLNTRAAVQAAGGDFAGARATAKKALTLTAEPALVRELRERLQLYERDQALPVSKDEAKRE